MHKSNSLFIILFGLSFQSIMFKKNILKSNCYFQSNLLLLGQLPQHTHNIKFNLYIFWFRKKCKMPRFKVFIKLMPVCNLNSGINLIKEVPNQHIISDLFHAFQWKMKEWKWSWIYTLHFTLSDKTAVIYLRIKTKCRSFRLTIH